MAEKLEFELEIKKNDLNSALDSGAKKASELNGILKTAAGVFVGNLATKGFEALTSAIDNSIDFAKESVKAYSEQEDALNKLGQALRASGDFSEEAIADFSDFASELQRTSKFGDEVVLSQLALAKSLGATNQRAKEIVQAAAELSAVFGGSLEENVSKLGKTLSGEVGRLGQLIPQLKELTQEQLRSGEAAALINERFSGSAAAELDTYTGSIVAASNAFSDLQEEIGSIIVDVLRLKDINNFLATVYQTLTDKVLGFRESLSRGDEGFKENEGSINRLSGRIAELTTEIEIQESRLKDYEEQAKTSFSAAGQVAFAKNALKELSAEYENTTAIINKFYEDQSKQSAAVVSEGPKQLTQAQKIANEELLSLQEQLKIQQQTIDEQYNNQSIVNEFERNQAELQRIAEFETLKSELEAELKQKRLEATLSGEDERLALQKVALEKELAQSKIAGDLKVKQKQNEAKQLAVQLDAQNKLEQQSLQTRLGYINAFGNLAAAVAKDGSKEQFFIQKAAAIAQSIVATQLAAAQALAVPPAPNVALASTAKTIGAINTAAIVATAIKGFAEGGIVGQGATMGPDNRMATVRDGEMILNAEQQEKLFNMINAGGSNGDIIVQVDSREIARAVRSQVQQGFRLV
jgi:DNA repair exonuclease SbcCD ATPase subunit